MTKQLLTISELKANTLLVDVFQACNLPPLHSYVVQEFRQCLGMDMLECLCDKVAEYDCEEWESDESYEAGDTRIFEGAYYTALVETMNEPTVLTDWELSPKFDEDCLQKFWCYPFVQYLSWVTLQRLFPTIATENMVSITDSTRDNIQTLREGVKAHIDGQVFEFFRQVHEYILANQDCPCLNLYKGLGGNCCTGCGWKDCKCPSDCLEAKRPPCRVQIPLTEPRPKDYYDRGYPRNHSHGHYIKFF